MAWPKWKRENWEEIKEQHRKAAQIIIGPCRTCHWRNRNCDVCACLLPRCVNAQRIYAPTAIRKNCK